jgi:hypothetical protein
MMVSACVRTTVNVLKYGGEKLCECTYVKQSWNWREGV